MLHEASVSCRTHVDHGSVGVVLVVLILTVELDVDDVENGKEFIAAAPPSFFTSKDLLFDRVLTVPLS